MPFTLWYSSLLVGLCLSLRCAAQETSPACAMALQTPLPAADQPDAKDRSRLSGCDAELLYYGAPGRDRDARLCAWLEREGEPPAFGGAAVLMMVYANGRGAERDFALARRFACETGGAPAELDGRLAHLDEMAAQDEPPRDFDLCDDVTSGYMMGVCAERDAGLRAVAREREWAAVQASWSVADRTAWRALRAAADGFVQARVDGEVDVGGTARGAFITGTRRELEDALLASVQAFERGALPRGDAAALQAADAQLNAHYRAARAAATPDAQGYGSLGTITPEGIRDAERAWLKYRDAWVVFGAQRYPDVPADAWREYFTRERAAQLAELAGAE